jgi:pimeloyl-ACP methyl ester carboxylesterase
MISLPQSRTVDFQGSDGNRLVADVFGETGAPVLLLHGAGQTRHAWRRSAEQLARAGWTAYALDQRGHGDSAWPPTGAYGFQDFAADARIVADTLAVRHGRRPAAIGASLGGLASLLVAGSAAEGDPPLSSLVMVDITPRVDIEGVRRVRGFMREHARDGFASVDEAAAAVAAYLPHRPRPRSNDGLKRNLRRGDDGRWRWHWDPRFLEGPRGVDEHDEGREAALVAAARNVTIPVLLVRGASSELVHDAHVREFLDLVPQAGFVDVAGARHMVAGDKNDAFSTAILAFFADQVRSASGPVAAESRPS